MPAPAAASEQRLAISPPIDALPFSGLPGAWPSAARLPRASKAPAWRAPWIE
jgi:hypothetical protein